MFAQSRQGLTMLTNIKFEVDEDSDQNKILDIYVCCVLNT